MNKRVTDLAALSRQRDLYAPSVCPTYDPCDYALPEAEFNAKRICEYILVQPIYLTSNNRFTGMLRFNDGNLDVPADAFHRTIGHRNFKIAHHHFYNKYRENLIVLEWQHTSPDYQYILENGITGSLEKIAHYREVYRDDKEKSSYLRGVEQVCRTLIERSEQCAAAHEQKARECTDEVRKGELLRLAEVCRRVPRYPARSFYEGLQSIIFCFQYLPDSVGPIDRVLYPLYRRDMDEHRITREEAKELIAEFFVHLSNHTPAGCGNADRSAECHFAIGGYTADGEDGFTDLSRLMVEALMEIDTRRPAMSLRWTKKTPFEVLKFMLDCERNDKNKRFAFVNDEPRIRAFEDICGFPHDLAVKYTMVGCNEPAFPGAVWFGGETVNIVRCLTNALYNREEEAAACATFEDFYALWREELAKDMERIMYYSDLFNDMRAKDINVLSAFLIDGCIENGKGPYQYGGSIRIGGFNAMGITCLIDSLSMIKQFVYDEHRTDMRHLIDVMKHNWETDENLRTEILKEGRFFGNNDELSDTMARRVTTELYEQTKNYRTRNGASILIGTLAGYNPHHMKFAQMTDATPDGRRKGDGFMVGTGQAGGKDRKGMLPLMRSLAQMDPTGILCGPNVCNMMIDGNLMKNDEYFDKVCRMIEQYFNLGGLHIQLNYITKEELLAAKEVPAEHQNLKVRVSGYSATFIALPEEHQEEIIARTVKEN